jgi:hypothetical protein
VPDVAPDPWPLPPVVPVVVPVFAPLGVAPELAAAPEVDPVVVVAAPDAPPVDEPLAAPLAMLPAAPAPVDAAAPELWPATDAPEPPPVPEPALLLPAPPHAAHERATHAAARQASLQPRTPRIRALVPRSARARTRAGNLAGLASEMWRFNSALRPTMHEAVEEMTMGQAFTTA